MGEVWCGVLGGGGGGGGGSRGGCGVWYGNSDIRLGTLVLFFFSHDLSAMYLALRDLWHTELGAHTYRDNTQMGACTHCDDPFTGFSVGGSLSIDR